MKSSNQVPTDDLPKSRTRNKKSLKGETKIFRAARKIKNLGVSRESVPDLPNCSFNCQNKTSKEERQEVWDEFRGITDMNLRLQHLANLIEISAPNRIRTPKSNSTKSRSCINKYYLKFNEYLDNSDYQLCKVCFMTVFNVTPRKIRTVYEKKIKEGDEIQYKRGGKHVSPSANYILIKSDCNIDKTGVCKIQSESEYNNVPYNNSDSIEDVFGNIKVKRNKPSKKGQTKEYRMTRKIKNLGIDREFVQDLPNCALDCRNRILPDDRQITWDNFRKIVDMSMRTKYLANLIQIKPISHVKVKEKCEQKRRCTPIFHLKWSRNGRNAPNRLCKVCFMAVFNLTNSKVRTIVKKKFENLELEYNRGKNRNKSQNNVVE